MKILLTLFSLFLVGSTTAQEKASTSSAKPLAPHERAYLLEVLRLSPQTLIEWRSNKLPPKSSHKLFLGSRFDFVFEAEIKTWVRKWNEGKEGKATRLQIIEDIQQADIVLVRFQNIQETVEETTTSDTSQPAAQIGGSVKLTIIRLPVYSYLLIPKSSGYEILWRQRKMIERDAPPKKNLASDLLTALAKQLR
jgi:hypothetical protein